MIDPIEENWNTIAEDFETTCQLSTIGAIDKKHVEIQVHNNNIINLFIIIKIWYIGIWYTGILVFGIHIDDAIYGVCFEISNAFITMLILNCRHRFVVVRATTFIEESKT